MLAVYIIIIDLTFSLAVFNLHIFCRKISVSLKQVKQSVFPFHSSTFEKESEPYDINLVALKGRGNLTLSLYQNIKLIGHTRTGFLSKYQKLCLFPILTKGKETWSFELFFYSNNILKYYGLSQLKVICTSSHAHMLHIGIQEENVRNHVF